MGSKRWKLNREDVLKYALHGVNQLIGYNAGNPFLTEEEEEEWERAQRELSRRLKIIEKQGNKNVVQS